MRMWCELWSIVEGFSVKILNFLSLCVVFTKVLEYHPSDGHKNVFLIDAIKSNTQTAATIFYKAKDIVWLINYQLEVRWRFHTLEIVTPKLQLSVVGRYIEIGNYRPFNTSLILLYGHSNRLCFDRKIHFVKSTFTLEVLS